MAKKDFSTANTGRVYTTIEEATLEQDQRKPRKTYTKEETEAAINALHTSGMKGVKLPRINLAFTKDNYEYIETMSRVRGESLTAFTNFIIAQHREAHKDLYDRAIEFRNSL